MLVARIILLTVINSSDIRMMFNRTSIKGTYNCRWNAV